MSKRYWWIGPVGLGLLGLVFYLTLSSGYCRSAKSQYGLELAQCPDGKVRQVLHIHGVDLQRKGQGMVTVGASALYTVGSADHVQEADVTSFEVALALVAANGEEIVIEPTKDGWKKDALGQRYAFVVLPDVPDGDYLLRARVRSKIGDDTVDLPLGLYAPARIHVLTDRPLYEPGNEVTFRAVAVRARDLTPIDHRPGTWEIRDPSGEVMLEEKAPAGEWGVVAGSFPLDSEAPQGTWTLTWRSGQDSGQATFRVEPFTLPRFRIEAAADAPYYQAGATPVVRGQVVYSSGAPVAGADIEIAWRAQGDWPPPAEWLEGALPPRAVSDENGRFVLELPEVPMDLQGRATLHASLAATDPAGDRVTGAASVLLSKDAIQVDGMTELDGLVQNSNNRLYLRVTTADGRSLPGARIKVRRAWDASDPGIDAELDSEGVARVQIDPGPPVNVVVPAMPVRVTSNIPRDLVALQQAHDLIADSGPSLADQRAFETWLEPLERCAKWVDSDTESAELGLRVSASGQITAVAVSGESGESLGRCVRAVVQGRRMPAGRDRLYRLAFAIMQSPLADIDVAVTSVSHEPDGLAELFADAARDARDCMPANLDTIIGDSEGDVAWPLTWQVRAGAKQVTTSWNRADDGSAVPQALSACLLSRLRGRALEKAAERDGMGVVRYSISRPYQVNHGPPPQPTIMQGYELLISAHVDDKPIGETRLRMQPGQVPDLRLRATPVLPKPGDTVSISLLRGPAYTGELPDTLWVEHLGDHQEIKVDRKQRTASFTIPADGKGWYLVRNATRSVRAVVYARAADELDVAVTAEKPRYAPGAQARLRVQTRVGGKGAPAAVGLFGVDQSLEQIASLPGTDELAALRPEAEMTATALGTLTAQALVLGRIRGDNAAEAMVLQVSSVPDPAELEVPVSGEARTEFDANVELTDRFYAVLAELHAQTRAWEASAPADELMKPETMARLWNQAVDACAARGEAVTDAFGRRLRLHYLPQDLLALTDPRQVVVVGTRLPEDVENWYLWVARKKP